MMIRKNMPPLFLSFLNGMLALYFFYICCSFFLGERAGNIDSRPDNSFTDVVHIEKYASDFSYLNAEPILYASRKTYEPEIVPSMPAPTIVSPPNFKYSGLITLSEGQYVALIMQEQSKRSEKVKVGEAIQGWKIVAINKEKIEIVNGDQKAQIEKYKSRNDSYGKKPLGPQMGSSTSGASQGSFASPNDNGGSVRMAPDVYRAPVQ